MNNTSVNESWPSGLENSTEENFLNGSAVQTQTKEYQRTLLITILPVIIVFGLVGNLFSLVVLKRFAKHSSFYAYLRVLGVSDTLFMCIGPPVRFVWILRHQSASLSSYYDDFFCTVYANITFVLTEWSTLITLAITIDRAIAVKHPLKASAFCTVRKAYIVSCVLLLTLISIHMPFTCENFVCLLPGSFAFVCMEIGLTISMLVYIYIPAPTMAVLNIVIGKAIFESRNARRRMRNLNTSEFRALPSERTIGTALTLFLINISYIVFALPVMLEQVHINYIGFVSEDNATLISSLTELFTPLNHSINILLYCISGKQFRTNLKQIICSCSKTSDRPEIHDK